MKTNILAFGAHPDDVELTSAGTLIRHIQKGHSVAIVDLTKGELGSRGNAETRANESKKASEILKINHRVNLDLGDGFLTEDKASLLKIVTEIRYFKPDVILTNAPDDRHPDHGIASKLVSRAAFLSGLPKIETVKDGQTQLPWRPVTLLHYVQDNFIYPDIIVDITEHFELKMKAVMAYETQFYQENEDVNLPATPISSKDFLDFLEARAINMGRYIGVRYGEGFIKSRPLGVNDLTDLF